MGSGSPRWRAKLVLGDVIRMRLGDIVPADARLLNGDPEEVDQSALTGESLPAEPKSGDAGIRQSRILSPHGSRGGAGTGSSHTLS